MKATLRKCYFAILALRARCAGLKVLEALAAAGLSNPFAFVNSGALTIGKRRSIDVVLAMGFNF